MDKFTFDNFDKKLTGLFQYSWFKLCNFFFKKNDYLISVYNWKFAETNPVTEASGTVIYKGELSTFPFTNPIGVPSYYLAVYNLKTKVFTYPYDILISTNIGSLSNYLYTIIYYNTISRKFAVDIQNTTLNVVLNMNNKNEIWYLNCYNTAVGENVNIFISFQTLNYFLEYSECIVYIKNNSTKPIHIGINTDVNPNFIPKFTPLPPSTVPYAVANILNTPLQYSVGFFKFVRIGNKIIWSQS